MPPLRVGCISANAGTACWRYTNVCSSMYEWRPTARDARNVTIGAGATAGEYFARWHWTLKLLAAMPASRDPSWADWMKKRANALRGWDISGTPPVCPQCRRRVQACFSITVRTVRIAARAGSNRGGRRPARASGANTRSCQPKSYGVARRLVPSRGERGTMVTDS
jgi:hypothetical protein